MKPRKSSPGYWKIIIIAIASTLPSLLIIQCGNANKQGQSSEETTEKKPQTTFSDDVEYIKITQDDDTLLVAPKMPQFPGGHEALLAYLEKNMQYPPEARKKGIQGRVVIQFVVGKDGSILSPRVVRSIDSLCDKEALRLIRSMPKWTPGKAEDGSNAYVRYTVPIAFRLQNSATDSIVDKQTNIKKDRELINKAVAEGLEIVSKDETNVVAPIMPKFPGGQRALVKYLRKNIKYPDEALMRGLEGRVVVGFVVEKDGCISKCHVVQTTDSIFNAEALRIVATMPRWTPGMLKDGRKISVFYRLPITFIPRRIEKEGNGSTKI